MRARHRTGPVTRARPQTSTDNTVTYEQDDVEHPTTIEVRKIVAGDRSDRFDLKIDGFVEAWLVGNSSTTGPVAVDPGTHSVWRIGSVSGTPQRLRPADDLCGVQHDRCADSRGPPSYRGRAEPLYSRSTPATS